MAGRSPTLLALVACVACAAPETTRPSLLLVTIDSLRADFLDCYGGEEGVGRRLCALDADGRRYVWAFSPSPRSAPSIASLLTSVYPSTHQVGASPASFLRDREETIAEILRAGGYATAAFVSSPELNRARNLQQGFDLFDDHLSPSSASGLSELPERPKLPERSAEETTDAAITWLRDAPRPWFVWIHYRETHGPWRARRHPGAAPPLDAGPGERLRVLPTAFGRGGIPSYQALPGLFTRESYEARYRDEIRYVDAQLSRLLDQIDVEEPLPGVLATADHGQAFGEDLFYFSHGHSVGLDQIRVPLLWRPPAGGTPERIEAPVSTLDAAPTLLRAAGLATPSRFEGRPLPSASDAPGAPQLARSIFAEAEGTVAVVSGSHYYSRDRAPGLPIEPSTLTAQALAAAGARVATLSKARPREALPPYEKARTTGIAPVLEPRLSEFLAVRDR